MTDTTDIAALLEKLNDQTNSFDTVIIRDFEAKQLVAAFEAERQRADKAELELIKPLPIGELIQRLEGQTYEKWFSQSDLKGDQVPVGEIVAWNHSAEERKVDFRFLRFDVQPGTQLFTAQQKPVVVLTDCDIGAVSHMAHWYSEEQCEAWVAGVEHAKKQIVAAGCIVQTGATDKADDHHPSAPAVLHDVLTAVSIGGSRSELIDALTAIKPKFGAPGSRDVDVRAAHVAIDKAIEKLSNL